MPTVKFLCALGLVGGILMAAGAAEESVPRDLMQGPFDIQAERIEYTNDTFFASGGVTGRLGTATVQAERISGSSETGDLRIEGDILFERGNIVWQGTELNYNYLTQTGDFGPSSLRVDPFYLTVDRVERVTTNMYKLSGARLTTCPKESPHLHARAKEATLVDQKYLTTKGLTVYAGPVPVIYVPYWRENLKDGIFKLRGGYGSEWGAHLLINASVPLTSRIESSTDVNLYSKRGVGIGQGILWDTPSANGLLSGFYLKDEDLYSRYDSADERLLLEEDRYRFKLEHRQYFSDTHYINSQANYLSDPFVTKEFLKKEHDAGAQPESYASWTYGNGYVGSEAFGSYRLNDFYGNTDRSQYSLDLYRTKIPGTPFYVESRNEVAALDRVFSNTNAPAIPSYDSVRLDSANTVYWPQRWGFLSLVPRAGYRATYYSKAENGREEVRETPSAGAKLSFHAAKVLSDRERWYGKGLRHKIEPYADYMYQNPSMTTNELPWFDSTDRLVDENKVRLGLHNVLQTRRKGRTARFVDLDLYTHYLVDTQEAPDRFDSLFIDARVPLSDRSMFDVLGEWDWNRDVIPFFNTRYTRTYTDVTLQLEHLYRDNRSSLWTTRLKLFPKHKWSADGYVRYDDNDNDLEEVAVTGYMNWCCMRYGLGYRFYDDGEHRVVVTFDLAAFSEAGFDRFF